MSKPIVIKPGSKIKLKEISPSDTQDFKDKTSAEKQLEREVTRLSDLQQLLHVDQKRPVVVVIQGMDTSGKLSLVRHLLSSVNPMGCSVQTFTTPTDDELNHDFLWRFYRVLPPKGHIALFHRSYYEDVVTTRVRKLVPESTWKERFRQINEFEALVTDLGTKVIKFFLHISREEQRKRIEERLKDSNQNWRYTPAVLEERKLWDEYQECYEDALCKCSTYTVPWLVIPADKKWYRNVVVTKSLADSLEELSPKAPKLDYDPRKLRVPE